MNRFESGQKRRPYGVRHALPFMGKMRHMHINTDTMWMVRLYGYVCVCVYMRGTAVDSLPRQTHAAHIRTRAHSRSISDLQTLTYVVGCVIHTIVHINSCLCACE